MKTEHLLYFVDLAETHALSRTAEKFFTSHQVIKKAILSLEEELNVKLIETNNQGATLTESGEILLNYAQSILHCEDALKKELEPFSQEQRNRKKAVIQLYITPYLTDKLILSFIGEYQTKNPKVTMELNSLPVELILTQLDTAEKISIIPTIEVATHEESFQSILKENGLEFFVLAERALYVCTHAKTKWAKCALLKEAELEDISMLVSSNITLNTQFVRAKNQQMVNSIEAQKSLIKMGKGIGIFTQKEFEYYFKNENKYVLIPTDIGPVQYICIHKKELEIPDHIQTFLNQFASCL